MEQYRKVDRDQERWRARRARQEGDLPAAVSAGIGTGGSRPTRLHVRAKGAARVESTLLRERHGARHVTTPTDNRIAPSGDTLEARGGLATPADGSFDYGRSREKRYAARDEVETGDESRRLGSMHGNTTDAWAVRPRRSEGRHRLSRHPMEDGRMLDRLIDRSFDNLVAHLEGKGGSNPMHGRAPYTSRRAISAAHARRRH